MAPDEFVCSRLTRRRVLRLVVAASAVMGAVVVLWAMRAVVVLRTTSQRADCFRGDPLVTPYRHLPKEEEWPEVEMDQHAPAGATHTVHYLWCGKKTFLFSHHLGVLSVLRILHPLKLVFHYTHIPVTDTYNNWFQELKRSTANMELRRVEGPCGTAQLLGTMLKTLSEAGGVYIGEGVVLTRVPEVFASHTPFWFAFSETPGDVTRGIVWANRGVDEAARGDLLRNITSGKPSCDAVASFDTRSPTSVCVTVDDSLAPRDLRKGRTAFAELARWLFYGSRRTLAVVNGSAEAIPRLSHYVWLTSDKSALYGKDLAFSQFLSILSALYVGGFERVWVHGNSEPRGMWWDQLKKENVTFLRLEKPATVFQQNMTVPAHMSDVLRFIILEKYGGAYQDFDVLWTSRVTDWLLTYPAVACPDWVKKDGWPSAFNMGVILARRRSDYLRHLLHAYSDYRDNDWNFNAVLMPFKIKELYPDTVYVYKHLQVLCCHGTCHAPWDDNYVRTWTDKRPVLPFHWRETRAVHVTCPKPAPSLVSPRTLKDGHDLIADVGRHVLEQSGRKHVTA